jgi:hypothetical protein
MWFKFWIKSSRGTDDCEHRWIPKAKEWTKKQHLEEVKSQLDDWIKRWDHLEYFNYGYIKKKPSRMAQKSMIADASCSVKYARKHLSFLKSQFGKAQK